MSAEQESRHRARTRIVVDRRLQFHFLAVWLGTSLSVVVMLGVLIFIAGGTTLGEMDPEVRGGFVRLAALTGGLFFIYALVMGLYGVFHTHRIAGAVLGIRKATTAWTEGKLDARAKLRERDYLQELADDLNVVASACEARRQKAREALDATRALRAAIETDPAASREMKDLAARAEAAVTEAAN